MLPGYLAVADLWIYFSCAGRKAWSRFADDLSLRSRTRSASPVSASANRAFCLSFRESGVLILPGRKRCLDVHAMNAISLSPRFGGGHPERDRTRAGNG